MGVSLFFMFFTTGVGHNYWRPPRPLLNQKDPQKKFEVLAIIDQKS